MKNLVGEVEMSISDKYFNFLVLSFSLVLAGRSPSGGGWPKLPVEAIHSQENLEVEEMKKQVV